MPLGRNFENIRGDIFLVLLVSLRIIIILSCHRSNLHISKMQFSMHPRFDMHTLPCTWTAKRMVRKVMCTHPRTYTCRCACTHVRAHRACAQLCGCMVCGCVGSGRTGVQGSTRQDEGDLAGGGRRQSLKDRSGMYARTHTRTHARMYVCMARAHMFVYTPGPHAPM